MMKSKAPVPCSQPCSPEVTTFYGFNVLMLVSIALTSKADPSLSQFTNLKQSELPSCAYLLLSLP